MENKIQELTDKIYREGVEKGNEEAQKLIAKAQEEAKRIIEDAHKEAMVTYEKSTANTHASAFAISSLIPNKTLKIAYAPMLITKVILPKTAYKTSSLNSSFLFRIIILSISPPM